MKLQTTTADFIPKLTSIIQAFLSLHKAGVTVNEGLIEDSLDTFLVQFEEPVPDRNSSVPLPPNFSAKNDSRMPAAWVAKHKINQGTLPSTVAAYSVDAEKLLVAKIAERFREEYEIVPLYPND